MALQYKKLFREENNRKVVHAWINAPKMPKTAVSNEQAVDDDQNLKFNRAKKELENQKKAAKSHVPNFTRKKSEVRSVE